MSLTSFRFIALSTLLLLSGRAVRCQPATENPDIVIQDAQLRADQSTILPPINGGQVENQNTNNEAAAAAAETGEQKPDVPTKHNIEEDSRPLSPVIPAEGESQNLAQSQPPNGLTHNKNFVPNFQQISSSSPHGHPQPQPHPAGANNFAVRQALRPMQPPFFGFPFRPSIIRNQMSSFVPLPPKEPITFDSHLCQDSISKRNVQNEQQSPLFARHLASFYLNPKNQDILFSVCGQLIPAHRVVIESISPTFGQTIETMKTAAVSAAEGDNASAKPNLDHDPIVIDEIEDLLPKSGDEIESSANESNQTTATETKCPNENLLKAFQIFLKFFYFGATAFDEIDELDIGFAVWRLGATFFDPQSNSMPRIESRIGDLILAKNLAKIYRFARDHRIASLEKRWAQFVNAHSAELMQIGRADGDFDQIACDDIGDDIEYLDRFIEASNVTQSAAIAYVRGYLRTCPQSASFKLTPGVNPFPRALQYYRCSIDDLRELLRMGFLNHETLADEFESRLRTGDRHCEEKCAAKMATRVANPAHRHVMILSPYEAHARRSSNISPV